MNDRALTVADVAERYGVDPHTILLWLKRGELKGLDVSRNRGGRPRWRITAEALAAFELSRTASPPPPKTRRRRQPADVISFY